MTHHIVDDTSCHACSHDHRSQESESILSDDGIKDKEQEEYGCYQHGQHNVPELIALKNTQSAVSLSRSIHRAFAALTTAL